jgi:hypothetical protein
VAVRVIESALERIEGHRVGRIVLSCVAVVVLVAIITPNLPAAPLTRRVSSWVRPVRDAVGLDGVWNVFAPGPRTAVIGLEARLEYADGSVRVWQPPRPDRLVGAYRYYHWQKWMEQVTDESWKQLWRPLAIWLARTQPDGGRPPATVTLVRRWRDLPPPGARGRAAARRPWSERSFYTYQVDPRELP